MHHRYSCVNQVPEELTGAPFLIINKKGTMVLIKIDLSDENIFQIILSELG